MHASNAKLSLPGPNRLLRNRSSRRFSSPNTSAERKRIGTIGVVDKTKAWDQLLNSLQLWRAQHGAPAINLTLDQLQRIQALAPREQRLMKALGHGLLNKEIARSLQLTEATVKTYRKQVATSLGVSGSQLVRLATLYRCWCLDQHNKTAATGNIQLP